MLVVTVTIAVLLLSQSHSLRVARQCLSTRATTALRPAYPAPLMMAAADHSNSPRQGGITTQKGGDGWKIWSVIEELETNGVSSNTRRSDARGHGREEDMTQRVVRVLRHWGHAWSGTVGWLHILNKKSLLHEVEESIVALEFLDEWLEQRRSPHGEVPPVTLVDVCCGKGILSMLASYLFRGKQDVSRIIMLDKQQDINWNHIVASNDGAEAEGRPFIDAWGGCNLHEIDQIVEKLQRGQEANSDASSGPLALVGIHLCKNLSPACAGIFNALGPERCPFLCLAPCCLPRVVRNLSKAKNAGMTPHRNNANSAKEGAFVVPVRRFESAAQIRGRLDANQRRNSANKRTFADVPCYLCGEKHPIHKCGLLPPEEHERTLIFEKAAALNPCWKCGEIGHFRKDCPSTQRASKPRLALPPSVDLDITTALRRNDDNAGVEGNSKGPFESYCELLSTALERENIQVLDVGLVNNSAQHSNAANRDNWNRDRKSIFIVASA